MSTIMEVTSEEMKDHCWVEALADYRKRCRAVIKDSRHTAETNLEWLRKNKCDPPANLKQGDMILTLSAAIDEWKEGKERWVITAKRG